MDKLLKGTWLKAVFDRPVAEVPATVVRNGIAHHASVVYGDFMKPSGSWPGSRAGISFPEVLGFLHTTTRPASGAAQAPREAIQPFLFQRAQPPLVSMSSPCFSRMARMRGESRASARLRRATVVSE